MISIKLIITITFIVVITIMMMTNYYYCGGATAHRTLRFAPGGATPPDLLQPPTESPAARAQGHTARPDDPDPFRPWPCPRWQPCRSETSARARIRKSWHDMPESHIKISQTKIPGKSSGSFYFTFMTFAPSERASALSRIHNLLWDTAIVDSIEIKLRKTA